MGNKYNVGYPSPPLQFVVNLPPTWVRTGAGGTPTPGPGRNIAPYTGGYQASPEPRRGVLFIRDALCNGPFRQQAGSNCDLSPHDFRLCPAVAEAGVDGSGNPWKPGIPPAQDGKGALNPLVNNGFFWNFTAAPQTFKMGPGNDRTFKQAPGYLLLPDPSKSSWTYTSWEEDCEGFGNPRAINHASFYPATNDYGYTYPNGAYCDIGADELHELIAVGYRFGTTMLIHVDGGSPCNKAIVPMDNKYLWYFGPPETIVGMPPTMTRPTHQYHVHIGTPTTYTKPPWWSNSWSFTAGVPLFYLPTYADIQPYLVPDIHPWWQLVVPGVPTNPIWQPTLAGSPPCTTQPSYNQYLYRDPVAGVINPPGTHSTTVLGVYAWLDGLLGPLYSRYNTIGYVPSLGGPLLFFRFDDWCRVSDYVKTMDTFVVTGPCTAGTPLTALRYSIEVPISSTWQAGTLVNSNQQSFMVIVVE